MALSVALRRPAALRSIAYLSYRGEPSSAERSLASHGTHSGLRHPSHQQAVCLPKAHQRVQFTSVTKQQLTRIRLQALQFTLQPQKGLADNRKRKHEKLWEWRRCKAPAGVPENDKLALCRGIQGYGKRKAGAKRPLSARGVMRHTRTPAKAPRITCRGDRGKSKRTRKQSSIAWASGAARSGLGVWARGRGDKGTDMGPQSGPRKWKRNRSIWRSIRMRCDRKQKRDRKR